jgi:hypothetical protein
LDIIRLVAKIGCEQSLRAIGTGAVKNILSHPSFLEKNQIKSGGKTVSG